MLVIWIALTVAAIVFAFTLLEVWFARWWIRRHRSASGVELAAGYHLAGPGLTYRDWEFFQDFGTGEVGRLAASKVNQSWPCPPSPS